MKYVSRHPLGGALRVSEEPPRAAFLAGVERFMAWSVSLSSAIIVGIQRPASGGLRLGPSRGPISKSGAPGVGAGCVARPGTTEGALAWRGIVGDPASPLRSQYAALKYSSPSAIEKR